MTQSALFGNEVLHPVGHVAVLGLDRQQRVCKSCALSKERTLVVPGEGNAEAPLIMFIGEGPGANEDKEGRPFVGRSGQLLDKMLAAMKLKREDVYIGNVVGCRPPGNRKPEPEEVKACSKFLNARIAAIRPRSIVALGGTAACALLKVDKPIGVLQGKWYEYEGIPVRCTFHPAFLLRPNGASYKKETWIDLQEVLKKVGTDDGATR